MGRSVHGWVCAWVSLCMGRSVHGWVCAWVGLCMGGSVHGWVCAWVGLLSIELACISFICHSKRKIQ